MKKIIRISPFFYLSIYAFNYSIENKTNGQIQILLEYEANTICPFVERIIQKNQKKIIKSGLCKAHQITIQGQNQSFTIKKKIKKKEYDQCIISIIQNQSNVQTSFCQSNIKVLIEYQK